MSSLNPESTVSHYKIKQLLGRGGMGEVYKAVDLELGRLVALKTLSPTLSSDQTAHQRFLREARAASILSHPGICTVFEVGRHDDLIYIAMQYIEGKTINQILSEERLSVETALAYAIDIADALDEAHRRGIIHRDIKPSNIIVNERDHAIVLDFGLAKQFALRDSASDEMPTQLQLTSETTILGTVPYMSPEQIRRESLDGRSDIFSFGVLFYEMLTGISPFNRPQTVDILHAILHDNPKPVSEVRPQAGRDLDSIISRTMAKDRDERYQSLIEMKTDLLRLIEKKRYKVRGVATGAGQNWQTGEGTRNRTASVAAAVTRRLTSTIKNIISSLTWRPAAIAFACVALAAAIWWYFSGARGAPDAGFVRSLNYVQLLNWRDRGGGLQDTHGVLSRDGKMIAFRSRVVGKGSIWIKQTGEGDPVQVVKDDWNNWSPIFSPDAAKIAFVSTRGGKLGIWSIPTFGGTPTLIAYLEGQENRLYELRHWSTDGETIFYKTNNDLFSIDISTGKTTQITRFDTSNLVIRDFSVSPGEDRIAYVDVKDGQQDLWVTSMAGDGPVQITKDAEEDVRPVWHPDGKRIIYSSKRDGIFQVCMAYLDNRNPVQITFGENDSFVSDVSADGMKVLYSGSREESDVWAVTTETGEEAQVTSDLSAELWADISSDGKEIAFQSVKQLSQSSNISHSLILSAPLDTEGQKTQLASNGMAPKWSPDGRTIAFLRTSDTTSNIWAISAVGGREKQVTDRGISGLAYSTLPYNRFNSSEFSWSPDSKRISYCSEIPDIGIWIISVEDRGEVQIASSDNEYEQFSSPLWSPDGSSIAYLSRVEGKQVKWSVRVADVKTGETKVVYQADSALRLLGWSPDNRQLIVAMAEGIPTSAIIPSEVKVFQVPVLGGASHLIAALGAAYLYNSQLSPDRRLIGIVSRADGKDNIYLVSEGREQPRKVTANVDPRLYFSAITWSPDAKKIYFAKQSRNSLIYLIDNFK